MRNKQLCPGFELGSPKVFYTTISATLSKHVLNMHEKFYKFTKFPSATSNKHYSDMESRIKSSKPHLEKRTFQNIFCCGNTLPLHTEKNLYCFF